MLTFNGNENILQNDMGNAQVMDAKTGNMIGLSDGFVPVGIKEHGGVLYIASYNPKTKQGELGTIPSPRIEYTLQDQISEEQIGKLLAGVNNSDILINDKISHDYVLIDTETLFRVGDQFIVQLDLSHIPELHDQTILTHFEDNKITPQLYRVDLYSKTITGEYIKIDTPQQQFYYKQGNSDIQESSNWFIPQYDQNGDEIYIDIDKTYKNPECLTSYPNIPSGYLCVKIEIEKPKNLNIVKNTSVNINCPIYYIL